MFQLEVLLQNLHNAVTTVNLPASLPLQMCDVRMFEMIFQFSYCSEFNVLPLLQILFSCQPHLDI